MKLEIILQLKQFLFLTPNNTSFGGWTLTRPKLQYQIQSVGGAFSKGENENCFYERYLKLEDHEFTAASDC